jgi:hypothetical protein
LGCDAEAIGLKFEEYIYAALASVKYGDFLAKGENSGVLITPGSGLVLSFLGSICTDLPCNLQGGMQMH